jgi:RNA polymerase sigma factor (sigma-70 family)
MEKWVIELLPLAAKMSREFSNIPGLPHAEIEMAAQEALARAVSLFDPAKGDLTAYAARAMRNALRDLYDRQLRHHQHHVYDLDVPATLSSEPRIQAVPALNGKPAAQDAAALESGKRLEQALATLSPRLRQVAEGIRDGKSYSEIGASLSISKQAAHKLAHAAITTLREKLESMGFPGLDTLGLLKSGCGVPPQAVLGASRHPSSSPQVDDFPPRP